MYRTLAVVCMASIVSLTTLSAQSSRANDQYDTKNTTITGCLEKNKSGGFWLTNGEVVSAGSKANSSAMTTSDEKNVRRATASGLWNLENGKDLDRYLNQQIQVTGRARKDTSGDELKGISGEMTARDFDVKTVSRISTSCR